MSERSGEIVFLREILADAHAVGKYVRVTGYVAEVDHSNPEKQMVRIVHDNASLWVDIALVVATDLTTDALVQFIGQINPAAHNTGAGGKGVILSAKVYRNVDGLDMKLYEEALIARREFLATSTTAKPRG